MTYEEEMALAERVRAGDPRAREEMILRNVPLVAAIVQHFPRPPSITFEDLLGEGTLGLIRAVEDFDPDYEKRFGPFASWWILVSLRVASYRSNAMFRVPKWQKQKMRNYRRAARDFRQRTGREPRPEEVAAVLGWSTNTAIRVRILIQAERPLSIERHSVTVADARRRTAENDKVSDLKAKLRDLDPRERDVLVMRFGLEGEEPMTRNRIGERLGISRERVRIIELRARERLGRALGSPNEEK